MSDPEAAAEVGSNYNLLQKEFHVLKRSAHVIGSRYHNGSTCLKEKSKFHNLR